MSAPSILAPILGHLRAEPSRTWSIVVTLYGDAVVPRGGTLWLGTVLEIFEFMGIGGNVVRTAMSRLAADCWLERSRVGRNAFYRLAEKGRETFAAAASRIYRAEPPAWDGAFRLAVLEAEAREAMRPALEAAGYAVLAPGVLVAANPEPAAEVPSAAVVRLRAEADPESARRLASQVWDTARLAEGYRRFAASFAGLRETCSNAAAPLGVEAVAARLLLVHEYRRLVLRDPMLPTPLLPPEWPGHAARELCAEVYPALLPESERWLDANGLSETGPLPPPDPALYRRFR